VHLWCQRSIRLILSRGFNSLLRYMVHHMPGLCTIFTDPFTSSGMMKAIGRKKEEATLLTSHLLAILLIPFRDGFTRPTWRKVLILLEGTLLARGRRTVTAALRMMGLHQLTRFNVFHHVLSRAPWSPLQMSRVGTACSHSRARLFQRVPR
jgi:hypothetical protein